MEANELRTGNWIEVICLDMVEIPPCFQQCNHHHITDMETGTDEWSYNPIPLTEEWFVKFGFVYSDWKVSLWGAPDNKGVFLEKSFNGAYESKITKRPIQYVHQLQNLYFVLNGIELTIK